MMANCHIRLRHYSKALMYFQILSTRHPDDMHLLLCIGQCYIGLKQYVDASQLFSRLNIWLPTILKFGVQSPGVHLCKIKWNKHRFIY